MNAADRSPSASRSPRPEHSTDGPRGSDGVRRATGRDRGEWFALLDAWGAAGRPYREIADWLAGEHGLSKWWAQKLIVEYEQLRGIRPPSVRRDGTFEVGASKTVSVPVERLFAAFADPELRARWLPDAAMRESASEPGRLLRFGWADGATRVVVNFTPQGDAKSQVDLQHQRLPDATTAADRKAYWRQRLTALKALLEESSDP